MRGLHGWRRGSCRLGLKAVWGELLFPLGARTRMDVRGPVESVNGHGLHFTSGRWRRPLSDMYTIVGSIVLRMQS